MSEKYKVVIIGGGPGGYLAALRAGSLGLKTAVIEKDTLGGICLNHGCIPTKVLTHAAAMYSRLQTAGEFGFNIKTMEFNYPQLQEKKRKVVGELVEHISELMKNKKVDVYYGEGTALSANLVSIKSNTGEEIKLETENVILATGSAEIYPPTPGIDHPEIITSTEALALEKLPETMAVIGGGVVALEMASIFMGLGVKVTIVHRSERLLRRMDLEMVRRLATYMRKKGLEIMMNSPIELIEKEEDGFKLTVSCSKGGQQIVKAESLLLAVGRIAAFGNQDLDALGVKYEHNGIRVNSKMETSVPGIYAVGDATYPNYYLAHTAYHQGIVAAENIAGIEAHFDGTAVPVCLFTDPELSSVGISEEEAREKGYENIKVGKFPFSANGKAATQGESEGAVKIISAGENDKVIGVHILGSHSSDLIQEGTMAIAGGLTAKDMAETIHAHPTLCESVWEAAMSISKASLHLTRR
jgi:dihydrolipoamide dehydrogenase